MPHPTSQKLWYDNPWIAMAVPCDMNKPKRHQMKYI